MVMLVLSHSRCVYSMHDRISPCASRNVFQGSWLHASSRAQTRNEGWGATARNSKAISALLNAGLLAAS